MEECTEPHAAALALLERRLAGGEIRVDRGTRLAHHADRAPRIEPVLPLAVIFAAGIEDVRATVRWAAEHGIAIVPRGAGTGVSGGAHAVRDCVVLSLERMNRVLEINETAQLARVEPGVVNGDLDALLRPRGLMFAPDPASSSIATIGGNIATNAGGLRCVKYGVTREAVLGLTVVLASGEVLRTGGRTVKNVSGLDLTGLFVGSEGILGVVVEATLRLRPAPLRSSAVAVCFPTSEECFAGMTSLFRAGLEPAIAEYLDRATLDFLAEREGTHSPAAQIPVGTEAMLLLQFDGPQAEVDVERCRAVLAECGGASLRGNGADTARRLLEVRKRTRGAESDTELRVGEDVTVPRDRLGEYVVGLRLLAEQHRVGMRVVAHAGDGNLHPLFWLDEDERARIPDLEAALDASISLALELGGTITGEHGIGQVKLRWFHQQHDGVSSAVHRAIKQAFDPHGILNPGKAFLPPATA